MGIGRQSARDLVAALKAGTANKTRPRRCRRPVEGQIYYNTTTHRLYCYDGSTWQGCW